jgi:hypothetical protein
MTYPPGTVMVMAALPGGQAFGPPSLRSRALIRSRRISQALIKNPRSAVVWDFFVGETRFLWVGLDSPIHVAQG